jgi:hypothetical protein
MYILSNGRASAIVMPCQKVIMDFFEVPTCRPVLGSYRVWRVRIAGFIDL